MNQTLIDTDILSLFMKGNRSVSDRVEAYLNEFDELCFSIITYYEIVSGLKHRDARKQLSSFLELSRSSRIVLLTQEAADIAAGFYAELRRKGEAIDDIDLLIAGIAVANELVLATHNTRHFERIPELAVEDWNVA